MFNSMRFELDPNTFYCMLVKDYSEYYTHINHKLTISDNIFLHEFLNDLNQMNYIQDKSYSAIHYSSYCYSLDNFLDNSILNTNLRKYFYILLCCTYEYMPNYILTDLYKLKNLKCIFEKDND